MVTRLSITLLRLAEAASGERFAYVQNQAGRTLRRSREDLFVMVKQYGSDVLASVHETAAGMAEAGIILKQTMRAFDELCLTPVEDLPPEKIREIRLRENASQAVFARHLNVTTGLVSQWERGVKCPRGASLKLLTLVARHGLSAVA